MKRKESVFKGRVKVNADEQKKARGQYGYLQLAKGVTVFKEKPGSRVRLDIIPYKVTDPHHPDRNDKVGIAQVGDLWYKRPFKIHRNVGPNNDAVVCPTSMGKRCPICEYRAKRIQEKAEKEETDLLKTSMRNLYVVIPLGEKDFEEKPHAWDVSQYLFQNLLNEEIEENEGCEVFPDLEEGLTLKIRFESTSIGKGQPFAEAKRIDFEERKDAYTEDVLEGFPSLDTMLNVLPYKELEAKFFEAETEEEEEDKKVEEKPKPPSFIHKPKPPVEERDEDEGGDEDEDERPQRSSFTRKPKSPTEEKEEKEDLPPPTPLHRRPKEVPTASSSSKQSKERCPHGHKFGVDTEKFDDCDSCKEWEDCIEEKEKKKGEN